MTAKPISFDFAAVLKAEVRFPTEEEQARGMTEVPRNRRLIKKDTRRDNKS